MNSAPRPRRPFLFVWALLLVMSALLAGAAADTSKAPPNDIIIPAKPNSVASPTPDPTGKAGGNGPEVKRVRPGTFKISVRDADLQSVLQLLALQDNRNIISTKEVTGKISVDLYDVTFQEALEAVLHASGFKYREKGRFVWVYTKEQYDQMLKEERKVIVKVFPLHYITATDANTLLTPLLSSEGKISITPKAAVGIAQSASDTGGDGLAVNDMILVRDYEDTIKEIEKVLAKADVRPPQVLIEATILRATLDENNALGVDLTVLGGVDFEGMQSTSDLTSVTTTALSGADIDGRRGRGSTSFSSVVPAGGLTLGLVTNNFAAFVRALQSVSDVTVLANPKLLVVNKQRGEVMVGNRNGYLTTTFTETTASQTVEFLETGTRLVVRPFVCTGGFIRLELHPEDSSGSVEQVGTSALPSETTTEVTTNVLVRDGHTIVIGGLFRESNTVSRAQVPLVGNVPYLGTLFRNTVDDVGREEVIILITPRIIKHESDEAVSEQIKGQIERFRVGSRRGLHWWSRERMVDNYFAKARRSLSAGDRAKALWYTDMSLSMDPRQPEAIRMKELLTEKAYWENRTAAPTVRFVIQRMIMQDMGMPVEPVRPPDRPLDVNRLDPAVRKAFGIHKRPVFPLAPSTPPAPPSVTPSPSAPAPLPAPAPDVPAPPAAAPSDMPGPPAEAPASDANTTWEPVKTIPADPEKQIKDASEPTDNTKDGGQAAS